MQKEFLKGNEVIEQAVTAAISDGFTEGSVTDLIRAPRNAPAGAISPLRGSRPTTQKINTVVKRPRCLFGDPPGTRTPDLRLKRALLYQLS